MGQFTFVKQTKKNRQLPRVECEKCNEPFRTQWAELEEDQTLQRGAVVSDRFELGRNFCNKLWNASRFVFMNLEDYRGTAKLDPRAEHDLVDRWILSRLNKASLEVTRGLED